MSIRRITAIVPVNILETLGMPDTIHDANQHANNRAEVSNEPTRERERQIRRFKSITYTSLGIGNVFPSTHLRIISGLETLAGLVLIGGSTSFTFLKMRRYWSVGQMAS
jgi:hypothetical protein